MRRQCLKLSDVEVIRKKHDGYIYVACGEIKMKHWWNRALAGRYLYLMLICMGLCLWAVPVYAENTLQVLTLEGDVQINEAGTEIWSKMTMKSIVGAGDRIRASRNALCMLGWDTFGTITLAENTIAEITKVSVKSADVLIKVGQLSATSSGSPGKILILSTSFAQIFAKKVTDFSLYITETQVGRLSVQKGVVIVKTEDVVKPALIKEGFVVEVRKGFLGEPVKKSVISTRFSARSTQKGDFAVLSLEVPVDNEVFSTTAIEVTGTYRQQGKVVVNGKEVKLGQEGAFSTILEFPEGRDTIYVEAQDPAGNKIALVRSILINTFLPEIDLFFPLYGPYVHTAEYPLRGVLADATPYDKVHILINRVEVPLNRWGFSHILSLKEGWNRFTLEAVDLAENFTLLDTALFLDTQTPEVILYQPRGKVVSFTRPPTPPNALPEYYRVEGRVIDPEPSSGIRSFTINSAELVIREDGSFSSDIVVKPGGTNRLFIHAIDRAGNEFRDASRTLTY